MLCYKRKRALFDEIGGFVECVEGNTGLEDATRNSQSSSTLKGNNEEHEKATKPIARSESHPRPVMHTSSCSPGM